MLSHLHFLHEAAAQPITTTEAKNIKSKSIYKIAIGGLILGFLGYFFRYFNSIFLTHWLSIQDYGHYSLVTSLVTFTGILVLFGIDKVTIKFLPAYLEKKSWGEICGLFKHIIYFLSLVFLILFGLSFVIISWSQYSDYFLHNTFWQYLWLVPFYALSLILSALLRVYNLRLMSMASQGISRYFFSLLLIVLFKIFLGKITLFTSLLAYLGGIFICIMISVIALKNQVYWQKIRHTLPVLHLRKWILIGLQLMLSVLILSTEPSIITILLKVFNHEIKLLALYNISYMLNGLIWISSSACASIFTTGISKAAAEKNQQKLQFIYNLGTITMIVPGMVIMLVYIFFGKEILSHFGSSYVAAYPALMVLTFGSYATLFTGMSVYFLEYALPPAVLMKATIIISTLSIAVGSIFCYYYGLVGAAIASTILQFSLGISYGIMVKVYLKLKPFIFI
ncbi:MAG: polysaccharide biosynthesis protein [Gammaproteobacteria bacterium]|jgi:stage V sporulation protein B|nr:polysaccharide biosynthesis protein [Gammaproteobacteria bacterium]